MDPQTPLTGRALGARLHIPAAAPFPRAYAPDGSPLPVAARVLGRAWVNGHEVGGPARRFAHLARSHD